MRECTGESVPVAIRPDGSIVSTCEDSACPYHHPKDVPPGIPPGYEPVWHAPEFAPEPHVCHYVIDPGRSGLLRDTHPLGLDGRPLPATMMANDYRCRVCGGGRIVPHFTHTGMYRRVGNVLFLRSMDDPDNRMPHTGPHA